jgi:hypothetical protein
MVKVGNLTGKGIAWNAVERQYVDVEFAKAHPRAILRKGDILFTAAAHGPKWIGLKVDMFDGAPDSIPSPIMCCGEIMICRPRVKTTGPTQRVIDPYFMLLFLRSAAGYEAIQHCIRGQSGHVYPEEVRALRIPDPNSLKGNGRADATKLMKLSSTTRAKAFRLEQTAERIGEKLFPTTVRKPIIAS